MAVEGEDEEGRRSGLSSLSAHRAKCTEEMEEQNKLPCSDEKRNSLQFCVCVCSKLYVCVENILRKNKPKMASNTCYHVFASSHSGDHILLV